jgi:hypothetical protein
VSRGSTNSATKQSRATRTLQPDAPTTAAGGRPSGSIDPSTEATKPHERLRPFPFLPRGGLENPLNSLQTSKDAGDSAATSVATWGIAILLVLVLIELWGLLRLRRED